MYIPGEGVTPKKGRRYKYDCVKTKMKKKDGEEETGIVDDHARPPPAHLQISPECGKVHISLRREWRQHVHHRPPHD